MKLLQNNLLKPEIAPRIHLEGNKAGVNALGKLGLPIEALNEEQVNALLSEIIEREGKFSDIGNSWLTNSATFATLAADVQSTIIGVLAATGVSCYKMIKSKLLK